MKLVFYIFLLYVLFSSSCNNNKDFSGLEEKVGYMLSNWVANDTAIDAISKGVKNFRIIGTEEGYLVSKDNKVYNTEFNIIDSYKDSILGQIYARIEIDNFGSIQMSGNKIAVKVDSIFQNGKKVDVNTSDLNSIVFLNEKIRTEKKTEKSDNTSTSPITLKEYVENLRNDGMTMFHTEGDNVLIFTRWDDPVGGNANSQAESLYRQAKAAHVSNIKTVRIVKMPEKKVVGRYVHK